MERHFTILKIAFQGWARAKDKKVAVYFEPSLIFMWFQYVPYLFKGVLTGPQIRDLFKCQEFDSKLSPNEKKAWDCIKIVRHDFLGKTRAPNYTELIDELISALHTINCNMSLKIHLLHSHVDAFPILESNDEQGERFHQDISYMEFRYKGKSKLRMLSDYCWNLIRGKPDTGLSRKRKMPFFIGVKPWFLVHRYRIDLK